MSDVAVIHPDDIALEVFHFVVGEELIEYQSEDIVLVFISVDLRAHLVGGCPYLVCKLLLVHIRLAG